MFSDPIIAIAKDLIDQFGNTYTLQKVEIHGYDPRIHKNDTTVTDITCKGVADSVNSNETVEGLIRLTDTKLTMYTEIDNINTSWTIDGSNIIHISKVGAQDKLFVYEAIVRFS